MAKHTDPVAVQAKLAKAGSSLAIHVARGKKLEGNIRSERMAARFDNLRKQAERAGVWKAYCQAAGLPQKATARTFFEGK